MKAESGEVWMLQLDRF